MIGYEDSIVYGLNKVLNVTANDTVLSLYQLEYIKHVLHVLVLQKIAFYI